MSEMTQQQKDAAYIDTVGQTVEEYEGEYGYKDVTRFLTPYELTEFVHAALREIDRLREIVIIDAITQADGARAASGGANGGAG